ncbi:MAG: methyltransferase domain-containing protein, partial [Gammaproteobacteria bacterium]|nr:methyltransferase domain-containing protein [Gammaproteobacteria bacterium]NIT17966.1 methyltransferase domain-containing protein [Gammaproteobacteria bacterium]
TDLANEQHYEVPAEFFRAVLGKHLKYSSCYWERGAADLDEAEAHMLALYAERAELADGQRVLDLGCGWGSFTLWAAQRYPDSRFTAVSNSHGQRAYIEAQAAARGLNNVEVVTADVNELELPGAYDRIVSVEMFEHMRNYALLLNRIAGWLAPDGKLFVHIFCHRHLLYP